MPSLFRPRLDILPAPQKKLWPELAQTPLVDLAGTKAAVVTQRAETKDYLDIHALLTKADIGLPIMLAAAAIIYGSEFNPLIALKAIAYHDDPSLADLPRSIRDLVAAVQATDPENLPVLTAIRLRRSSP